MHQALNPSFVPFVMERWQSAWENEVACNLAESGVEPVTVAELQALSGGDGALGDVALGYGYTNGGEPLRAAVAALYNGGVSPEQVVITNGSAEANFVVLWELVVPGREVVVLQPAYMQAPGLVRMFGGEVKVVWLREELGWQPDPAELRRAVGDRTRLVVVTNPNNPTGAVLVDAARNAIVEAADRVGAWILADEVYAGAELAGSRTASFWGQTDRVVSTGSLSKAYGLAGLRLGWAVAPQELAARLWARTDYTTIGHGPLIERLATLALAPAARDRLLQRTRRHLRANLKVLDGELVAPGLIEYRRPDAGAIAWVRPHSSTATADLAEQLRRDYSVLVVPGEQFQRPGFLRLGYGVATATLQEGVRRLRQALG